MHPGKAFCICHIGRWTRLTIALAVVFCLGLPLANPVTASPKNAPQITPLLAPIDNMKVLRVDQRGRALDAPTSAVAVECISRHDKGAAWAIGQWLIGNELYKSYQNPPAACAGSYPYTTTEVRILLMIDVSATITVAIDLEKADTTFLPGCPVPGDIIYIGPAVDLTFPGAGFYDVQIVLDTPKVVSAPFFVGFYFASTIEPGWNLQLVTDSVEKKCVSFNIWDTAMGYVDLGDDVDVYKSVYPSSHYCYNAQPNDPNCFSFDGRVILHTRGALSQQTSCCNLAGDANNDNSVDIGDVAFIVARVFQGGAPPSCADEADANGDNSMDISDAIYLVTRMFQGGVAPICGTTGQ